MVTPEQEPKPTEMLADNRKIISIEFDDVQNRAGFTVGRDNVTAIVVYGEPAQYCNVPFFAVHQDDGFGHNEEIRARVPAGHVTVFYAATAPTTEGK